MKFEIFRTLPDATIEDGDSVHSRYDIEENKKINGGNFLFYGDESAFFYMVKCYFLKNFSLRNYIIMEGNAIVEKYHVPQKDRDGTWLTVSNLNIYDLLVLLFTSGNGYETLKNCVVEVLKNRGRIGKPTWIYLRDELKLSECKEYSKDLDQYLESFRHVNVNQTFDYKGYNKKISDKAKVQDFQEQNAKLANF